MDAIQEIRLKFINVLKTTIGFSQLIQWELDTYQGLKIEPLSSRSAIAETDLTAYYNLIIKETPFLQKNQIIIANLEGKSKLLETISLIPCQYPLLAIPFCYQARYWGGLLIRHWAPDGGWLAQEIAILQDLVEQYVYTYNHIRQYSDQMAVLSLQKDINIVSTIASFCNRNEESCDVLQKILVAIGEYLLLEKVQLFQSIENENKLIQQWDSGSRTKTQILMTIPIVFHPKKWGNLILRSSISNRCLGDQELQFVEEMAQYIAVILQQAELKQQLQTLTEKNHQLEATNQNKSDFLSHINHELRTPLTGILGFARMLQEEIYGPLNEKQKQYMQGIINSGDHLLALINDFLDISKIEANREELFLEMVAVEDVCLSAFSILRSRAKEQGIELNLEIEETVNTCTTDQRRLKQILLNLLSNAIKFTEQGSVTLKVEHHCDKLTFSVIDTGIGMKTEDLAQLFQPFQQIHNHLSRKHKGTGLGLALSRKLAQLHGGDITVTSKIGQGSCFTLHLPL
ncbi:MAG: HAMP domain-containing sensor histidine kinase [Snowella sp.]|nr:HAMP domain-containing sensor histidine kinase [Snowella sp.]